MIDPRASDRATLVALHGRTLEVLRLSRIQLEGPAVEADALLEIKRQLTDLIADTRNAGLDDVADILAASLGEMQIVMQRVLQ